MKPIDKIRELINKSYVRTGPETERRILGDALEHLEKLKQRKSAGFQTRGWVRKLAVAATILVAFGIGFSTGRWSKPIRSAPPSIDVTSYTSEGPVYPGALEAEDSFWRQKALAAMQPRPYVQSQFDTDSLFNTYKQYLKEKYYE